jgi:type I restriction enzyme M protein
VLFIDARKLGTMVDRTHRELLSNDTERIAGTYHAWRGESGGSTYEDKPGFCSSATKEEIAEHRFVLTPGRYVGLEDTEDDGEPIQQKIQRLNTELLEAFSDSDRLQNAVRAAMGRIDG